MRNRRRRLTPEQGAIAGAAIVFVACIGAALAVVAGGDTTVAIVVALVVAPLGLGLMAASAAQMLRRK